MPALLTTLQRRPDAVFAAFLIIHFCLWTALPAALYLNLPLDLIEALTYGREWQLGYDKLPPLPWWLVEIAHRLIGYDIAYYALAQLAVVVAFFFVWAMARPLVDPLRALLAIVIIDGQHYLNFTAAKFNHDVIQLPLWALAGYAYWRALRGRRLIHWIALGAAIGLAVWAKYFVVVLALPLALFVLLDRQARASLATPGPYLAVVVALAIMAPHLVWLVQNDFLPFAYAEARAAPSRGIVDHLFHPAQFAADQLGFLVPSLLIAAPLFWRQELAPESAVDAFDRRVTTVLAFGPMATVLALSAVTGRGAIAMWGYPLWLFLGIWIVLYARTAITPVRLARVVATWAVVFALFAIAFAANYSVLAMLDQRYRAVFYPGDRLADELARRFRAATGQPLVYVIGNMWDGGNVAHYAREQPRVLIDGDPRRAPWIDLGDLRSKGAVVVWTGGDPAVVPVALRGIAGDAQVQPPFTLPFRRGGHVLTVGWAILRPLPAFARRIGSEKALFRRTGE